MAIHNNDENRLAHAKVGSLFLGPRAENFDTIQEIFQHVLQEQKEARETLYPDDPNFITQAMKEATTFKEGIETLKVKAKNISKELSQHSIPFWSPRYNAHMNMDTAMSSIIGYMTAMMYNPNNVATEASPLTTEYERKVGQQLCHMLGYGFSGLEPWGHITCDGSVANLEAIWAIRNLKFYSLSLTLAIKEDGPLNFLANADPPFRVFTCKGEEKEFMSLSTWELLNLTPEVVLDIPTRLNGEYSITPSFLQDALSKYLIQTVGKDYLEKAFGMKKSGKFFVSATKHYSWPKGGAISGIGSGNFIDIQVDDQARMDIEDLRKHLDACLEGDSEDDYTPVFGGVAIIGSTEHGACDPINELIRLRREYQEKGLSFAIHCDAAWGGYFASMVERTSHMVPGGPEFPLVPILPLQPYTLEQLEGLAFADSITIDPHKSGYINYPAGGLCYRDARMRYLVTWTSPIVFHQGDDKGSMGVYGVEGSKPGAAAVATWLTHETIGLNKKGYGRLLGEAVFTCTKLYCYWATMTKSDDHDLIVAPLIRLPSERKGLSPSEVEAEKEFIRTNILGVSNEELVNDVKTFNFMAELGGDLMINAFACNFKIDGKPNTDVGEANYLNQRLFQRFSVTSLEDKVSERPLFLTSSTFSEKAYGRCLSNYKTRLQLDDGKTLSRGDLMFLVNVTMSPWPTDFPFLNDLVTSFRDIARQEVARCVYRNKLTRDIHGFVMQGHDQIYLTHIPMFQMGNHRWQLIITADFPEDVQHLYQKLRKDKPDVFYTTANVNKEFISDLVKPGAGIEFRMDEGIPGPTTQPLATFKLSNVRVVVNESMQYSALDKSYPDRMPFYLYGTKSECHIDHVLKKAPNAQLSSDLVKLDLKPELSDGQLSKGVIVVFDDVFENSIQPLVSDSTIRPLQREAPGFNFTPRAVHRASVYDTYDNFKNNKQPIAKGNVTLSESYTYADWDMVNMDPADELDKPAHDHAH